MKKKLKILKRCESQLQNAIENYKFDIALKLIESGYDVFESYSDFHHRNPLYLKSSKHFENYTEMDLIFSELINCGLDINHKDDLNTTPLIYSIKHNSIHNFLNILNQKNVDLNHKDNSSKSAIDYAIISNVNKDLYLYELLKCGADITLENLEPYEHLDILENYDIQKLILEKNGFLIDYIKNTVGLHENLKEEFNDLDFGNELGTI